MVEKSFRFSMSRPELVCQSREARRIRPKAAFSPDHFAPVAAAAP
jgi:hypothetical protein